MNRDELRKALKAAQAEWVELANKENLTPEDRENRDAAEQKVHDLKAQLKAADAQAEADAQAAADARRAAEELRQGQGRVTEPDGADRKPRIGDVKDGFAEDPKVGFADHVEFFSSIRQATVERSTSDNRLNYLSRKRFAAAGSDEHGTYADPYGGFFIPEALLPMRSLGMDTDPTQGVTVIQMSAPVVNIPARVDKNHTSSVSGGLRVYRRAEADTVPSSRMEHEMIELKATSLFGVAYATQELLERSPVSFVSLLESAFGEEFLSKMIDERISGTGVGKPQGILGAPATIEVPKESMQSADTINGTNILKMRQRAWRYGNSRWITNHDTYLQLVEAHTSLTNDDKPLFTFTNGTDVPDTLLGRPITFTEHVPTLGDVGDIILADWSQYLYGVFRPLRNASSMHVRFLEHEETFKFWIEDAGAPWWRTALTPKNGANTLSPFVTLAARA